jgi:ribosome-binding ATPase YchF (GTP1/OBG family)
MGSLNQIIIRTLNLYIQFIAVLLRVAGLDKVYPFSSTTELLGETKEVRPSIDERIAKIDMARKSLVDVINAIDELKKEAYDNKKDAAQALQQIDELEKDKESLNKELDAIRTVIRSDVEGFRHVAGITNRTKERVIGFISGIIASMIASGIILGLIQLIRYINSNG